MTRPPAPGKTFFGPAHQPPGEDETDARHHPRPPYRPQDHRILDGFVRRVRWTEHHAGRHRDELVQWGGDTESTEEGDLPRPTPAVDVAHGVGRGGMCRHRAGGAYG